MNLLISLVETASRVLGDEFCHEIMEIHHKMKKDAPSGTALTLGDALAATRGFKADNFITAREGMVGERPCDRVGIMALRGGDVVGEHTVYFLGSGERIELTHRASDRSIFARGAWRAANWVVGRPAGLYSMADVLGI